MAFRQSGCHLALAIGWNTSKVFSYYPERSDSDVKNLCWHKMFAFYLHVDLAFLENIYYSEYNMTSDFVYLELIYKGLNNATYHNISEEAEMKTSFFVAFMISESSRLYL